MYSALTYFESCTLKVVSYNTEDEGKTISVTGGGRTFSKTLVNGEAIFQMLPPKNEYTITLLNNEVEEYNNKIVLGSGDYVIHELNEPEPIVTLPKTAGTQIATLTGGTYTFTKDYDLIVALSTYGISTKTPVTQTMNKDYEEYCNVGSALWTRVGTSTIYTTANCLIIKDVKAGDTLSFGTGGTTIYSIG